MSSFLFFYNDKKSPLVILYHNVMEKKQKIIYNAFGDKNEFK